MKPILVVDDDPHMRAALKEAIQRTGHTAVIAEDGKDALGKLARTDCAMVVTDMKMPRMDGLSLLREVRQKVGRIPFLVITGFGTIENAVEAMKEGASEYLMKPFSFDTLTRKIDSLMDRCDGDRQIVTQSPRMQRLLKLSEDVAAGDTTVLICGESGTGKELLARHIHRQSLRRERPFVAVNCAAIPDSLMESELFGHEKGAFTGAAERRTGKFEQASGGTILLDEIGEMPLPLQAKLLRVLQEKEVDRIGGRQPVPVDIRVIATTNRDLYRESLDGRFREDLYYRLSVFPLVVPPLRERPEDIPALADHFLRKFASQNSRPVHGFSEDTLSFLCQRGWRGNIRELENTIQRAVLVCRAREICMDDLMLDEQPVPVPPRQSGIREMERDLIMKTLEETAGNKTQAARILGVSVRTIRNKLNEYGKGMQSPAGHPDCAVRPR